MIVRRPKIFLVLGNCCLQSEQNQVGQEFDCQYHPITKGKSRSVGSRTFSESKYILLDYRRRFWAGKLHRLGSPVVSNQAVTESHYMTINFCGRGRQVILSFLHII